MASLENGALNCINSGFNLETSLLNLKRWNTNYKYYYFNLNNLTKVENVSQNVELIGNNDTNVGVNLSIFIIYSKKVTIDKRNGNIIEIIGI
jgi:hypothetical protein